MRYSLILSILFLASCGGSPIATPPAMEHSSKVVFIGDSITYLWDLSASFPGKNYINKGIAGHTSAMVLARFDSDVIALQPDTVVILIGLNDINQNVPLSDTQANISSMVTKARTAGIKVILCTVLPIGAPIDPLIVTQHNQEIVVMDGWIRVQYVLIADYYSAIQVNGILPESLSLDGGHPNADGYKVLTAVIAPLL